MATTVEGVPLDAETERAYIDALDDVHTRFVLNLPDEEFKSADRIFFQLEQAWWFYEDHICDQSPLPLPRFKGVKPFASKMFEISPLLEMNNFARMWNQFSIYKRKISTYGTILMNESCTKIALCRVYQGQTWTFPAGKINQNESGKDAAARETYEETGFDPNCLFGKTKEWLASGKPIPWQYPLRDEDALVFQDNNDKRRTCYVCLGVPEDFDFAPVARKEVDEIQWFDIDDMPKTFAVLPFLGRLRGWIKKRNKKKRDKSKGRAKSNGRDKSAGRDKGRSKSNGRDRSAGKSGRKSTPRRRIVGEQDGLVDAGLANAGDVDRWSEEDMFRVNEQLSGRRVDYDGNPHVFAEQGFQGNDPHAFRVVGGAFMNSSVQQGATIEDLVAPPPSKDQQQPLFKSDTVSQLTPFFSEGGETPWGEVVEAAKISGAPKENAGEALLAMLQSGARTAAPEDDPLDVMTDAQITKKNQERNRNADRKKRQKEYEEDMDYINQWVKNLPRPVDFRIKNVDAILARHFS